jgi:hypothetical protein
VGGEKKECWQIKAVFKACRHFFYSPFLAGIKESIQFKKNKFSPGSLKGKARIIMELK